MMKVGAAIIGSGNVGMNLLYKIKKSSCLDVAYLIGRNPESANLKTAEAMGYSTSTDYKKVLAENAHKIRIVFDATTAEAHKEMSAVQRMDGRHVIDLTPSKVGEMCVPCLNGNECVDVNDVNMVTCGGQSVVPLAVAISGVADVEYFESVSTIASLSAGAGTRSNIDEYIYTTQDALKKFTGVQKSKSLIVLNPATPPINMHNTLYARINNPDMEKIGRAVQEMTNTIQHYVQGFSLKVKPTLYADDCVAVSCQVEGDGDYLPPYAGNLDIITCAAVEIAERKAKALFLNWGG